MADERSRLGRGLAALIGDVGAETPAAADGSRKPRRAPIENIRANPRNPRRTFTEVELAELTASIKERGVIQPIVVRAVRGQEDKFEIIAGERRWRASQRAGLHDVPVVVVEANDAQSLELAIIENVQRADLNALEEAAGYQALMDTFNHSQDGVAQIVGKSRSHVANTLRLLKLPDAVKAHLASGKLTAGHARMLIGQPNAAEIANDIVSRGLNVRQVEALARDKANDKGAPAKPALAKDSDTRAIEKRLSDALGLKVSIDAQGKGGSVRVNYKDLEQLDEIIRRLERR
ncbi:MAG: ParB/RepB/Spo0J family partition protein [Pseudolabrys sp.]|nr:ParB/RepB/Spo0J family partition protein [Pseudolabrys sp.]